MSLAKCRECLAEVSTSAKVCPKCGVSKPVKRTSIFVKVLAGFFGLVLLSSVVSRCTAFEKKVEDQKQAEAEKARVASLSPEEKAAEEKKLAEEKAAKEQKEAEETKAKKEQESRRLGLIWSYEEEQDKMGRGAIKNAFVQSLNLVEFGFPYQGPQRASLQLRRHPKYGKDVILSIQKGQFMCGFDGCKVNVRFDNGKEQVYSASEPEDNSTTTLFLGNYDRFLAGVRKSKKVYIEAKFFQEGNRVFEFDVSGMKW